MEEEVKEGGIGIREGGRERGKSEEIERRERERRREYEEAEREKRREEK
jgi:hypothetical protein